MRCELQKVEYQILCDPDSVGENLLTFRIK